MHKKHRSILWLILSLAVAAAWQYWRPAGDWQTLALRLGLCCGLSLLLLTLPGALARFLRRQRYLNSSLSRIDLMSGREFEEFLAAYFRRLGYRVEATPASNDYGVDLLLRDRQECLAVQAKRYSGTVGVHAVQELLSGMAYYQVERGLVISNAYFSRQAWELAEKGGVELWDRDALAKFCRLR